MPEKTLLMSIVLRALKDVSNPGITSFTKKEAVRYLFYDLSYEPCSLNWIADFISPNPDLFVHEVRRVAKTINAYKKYFLKITKEKKGYCVRNFERE